MTMLHRSLLCAAALASLAAPAVAGGAQLGTVSSLADTTDQFVVTWKAGAAGLDAAATASVLAEAGLSVRFQRGDKLRLDRRVPHAEADRLAEALRRADPRIAEIHPDRWATIQTVPNDPRWADQWHYHEKTAGIRLPKALDKSTGAGVVVAVLDTGYRPHADLAANLVPGYDMIIDTAVSNDGDGRDADAQDPGDGCGGQSTWHGTHVAGTIAAVSDNGLGVAGVAPGAKVQPVRVLGCGGGYFSDIVDGITWASGGTVAGVPANPTPARVINMSLSGGGACPASLQSAINGAVARGTVVVVAAGNNADNAANYAPANCDKVITVASVNRSGSRAWYSNYGAKVEIAAPGGDTSGNRANGVLSTLNDGVSQPGNDSYAYYQGTSMATPHVAGVAALILANRPSWTPAKVLARLQSTARPFPGTCNQCGSGIVNAGAAVPKP
jgi:serine protease